MENYETYLNHPAGDVLMMEDALSIYTDMCADIKKCNSEDLKEYVDEFVKSAYEYAYIRNQWEVWDRETKIKKDDMRTALHNGVIYSLDVLARFLNMEGIETPWKERLGANRKRVGDFACFVAYMVGINNR